MKILNTFCVFAAFVTSEISRNVNCFDTGGDVSLSDDAKHILTKIPNSVLRQEMEHFMTKKRKFHKKQLQNDKDTQLNDMQTTQEYFAFRCAVDEIKNEAFCIFPAFRENDVFKQFTTGIWNELALPEDLKEAMELFKKPESAYLRGEGSSKKMKSYFQTMFAFLKRCNDPVYKDFLPEGFYREKGVALREEVIKRHEVNASNGETVDEAFLKFSSSYARVRQGADSMHCAFARYIHVKALELKEVKQCDVSLPEVLAHMHFLQAWNFSTEDLVNVNIVHKVLNPPENLGYLSTSYKIKHTELRNKKLVTSTLTGVLPLLNLNECSRLLPMGNFTSF